MENRIACLKGSAGSKTHRIEALASSKSRIVRCLALQARFPRRSSADSKLLLLSLSIHGSKSAVSKSVRLRALAVRRVRTTKKASSKSLRPRALKILLLKCGDVESNPGRCVYLKQSKCC